MSKIESPVEYYGNRAVRARLAEFCGGRFDDPGGFTSEYLVGFGEPLLREGWNFPVMVTQNGAMETLLDKGLDVFRSVWDRASTLALLDIEYFHLDSMEGLYRNQIEHFEKMEPAAVLIGEILRAYGIPHLCDTTTSGYHFASRIPFDSPVHGEIVSLGRLDPGLEEKYARIVREDDKRRRPVPIEAGLAYSGVGRLMEFLCHRVIREGRQRSPLPLTVSDAAPGTPENPREGLSLDLTQYGDALYMRSMRLSFSTHQKHKVYRHRVGAAGEMPIYLTVPRNGLSVERLFEIRRDFSRAAEYASGVSSSIPDASEGWRRMADDYRCSSLFRFHRDFDAFPLHEEETWKKACSIGLPPCVAVLLDKPNPALLQPTNIQTLCRVLYACGLHSGEIGGLLSSIYCRPIDWPVDWRKYSATTRGNFWARIYCGLIVEGLDTLAGLDCDAHRRRGACVRPDCGQGLTRFRK